MNSERAEAVAAGAANLSKPLDETITLHRAALADLAAFAAHALQPQRLPGGAQRHGAAAGDAGATEHPDLHWVAEFGYRDNGITTGSRPPHRTRLRRKSLLIYGKRGFRLPPGDDVIELPPAEPGAAARRQGQLNNAGLELILARFARPGQVLCDPCC